MCMGEACCLSDESFFSETVLAMWDRVPGIHTVWAQLMQLQLVCHS